MKICTSIIIALAFCLAGCAGQNAGPLVNKQQEAEPLPESDDRLPSQSDTPAPTAISPHRHRPAPGTSTAANKANQEKVLLDIPIIKQNPELKYGCEVTSLAMVLQYAGVKTDKLKLAREMPKDKDPVQKNASGDITRWGNPNHGFVGDITGKRAGYAIYAKPLEALMRRYLPDRTLNLTKKPFDTLLAQVQNGKPVIVWTTGDYKLPDRWESWRHGKEKITTPLDLHAVVLVGYDREHVYLNDPLTGKKAQKTGKHTFIQSWNALGQQALSYR